MTTLDDALPPPLFRGLRRVVAALGTRRLRETYQTTFWFDLGVPRAWPEAAALSLRRWLPRGRRVIGVEWWLSRMRTTNVAVDFHRDRDERLALRTGRIVHPRWSSVLFLNRCRGGLLVVTEEAPNPANVAQAPDRHAWDLARPHPNRLALFPGNHTHGVLDARNQIPAGRLPGKPPLRLAVVFNWWDRRPERTPSWSGRRFSELGGLSLPAVGR